MRQFRSFSFTPSYWIIQSARGETAPIKRWNVSPCLRDSVSSDNVRRLSGNINMGRKDIFTAVKMALKGGNVWSSLSRRSVLFSFTGLLWDGLTTMRDCWLLVKRSAAHAAPPVLLTPCFGHFLEADQEFMEQTKSIKCNTEVSSHDETRWS